MSDFAKRVVYILMGDERLEGVKIDFSVSKDIHESPPASRLTLFNLKDDTINNLNIKGAKISLYAGYAGNVGAIYSGEIRDVETRKENQDKITSLILGGSDTTKVEALFSKSYNGNIALHNILMDVVESMGLSIGTSLDQVPNETLNGYSITAKSTVVLTQLLTPRQIEWFEQDGEIGFSKQGSVEGSDYTEISIGNGLIGSVSKTDTGIRLAAVLNPNLTLNRRIRVESDYKVTSLEFKGSNRGGTFRTEIEAVAL